MFRSTNDGESAAISLTVPIQEADPYDGLYLGVAPGSSLVPAGPLIIEVTFVGHEFSDEFPSVQLAEPAVSGSVSLQLNAPDCVTAPFSELAPIAGAMPFPRFLEEAGVLVVRLRAASMGLGECVNISGLGLRARSAQPD